MNFSDKLKSLMRQQGLTQAQVVKLTGIGNSSISQYLTGKHEPSNARKIAIARALGVQDDYFSLFMPDAEIQQGGDSINIPVRLIAKVMHKSKEWVEQGLRDGVFPWGYAVKLKNWSYFISGPRFVQETGIALPLNINQG